jgi:hypothetical protein
LGERLGGVHELGRLFEELRDERRAEQLCKR